MHYRPSDDTPFDLFGAEPRAYVTHVVPTALWPLLAVYCAVRTIERSPAFTEVESALPNPAAALAYLTQRLVSNSPSLRYYPLSTRLAFPITDFIAALATARVKIPAWLKRLYLRCHDKADARADIVVRYRCFFFVFFGVRQVRAPIASAGALA